MAKPPKPAVLGCHLVVIFVLIYSLMEVRPQRQVHAAMTAADIEDC